MGCFHVRLFGCSDRADNRLQAFEHLILSSVSHTCMHRPRRGIVVRVSKIFEKRCRGLLLDHKVQQRFTTRGLFMRVAAHVLPGRRLQ